RTLGLCAAALLVAACSRGATRSVVEGPIPAAPMPGTVTYGAPMEASFGAGGFQTASELGEGTLENLPWHPAVLRADLSATGPVDGVPGVARIARREQDGRDDQLDRRHARVGVADPLARRRDADRRPDGDDAAGRGREPVRHRAPREPRDRPAAGAAVGGHDA